MNVRGFFLVFFLLAGFSEWTHAQEPKGKVVVVQDTLLPLLQAKRLELLIHSPNESTGNTRGETGTVLGFRVQIYTGTSRSGAYAAQSQFQRLYPNVSTYVSYTQPNYRVKIGDFRSRSDAQSMMNALKKHFNVFLFTEEVNVSD